MATIAELLTRNKAFASTHQPIPTFEQLGAMNTEAPDNTIVITCADPRCVPESFLNLKLTDGVIIFRNVGGHVTHALTDILALDGFLGIKNILVIHHTDCGTSHFKDANIREGLNARLPQYKKEIDSMSFGNINDLEQSVRDDLAILRSSPFIRKELADHSFGFTYDLVTGVVTPVEA